MELSSIFFGLFIGLFLPTLTKVAQQTQSIWRRTRRFVNIYLYMIWTEAIVNLIFSITTYLFICGVIKPSLAYFFGAVLLWAIQTQLLSQIIANRVSLIMVNKRRSQQLKWTLFILIGIVNISVFCIWIMAHMPSATPKMIFLNKIWERIEKSFFLIVDSGLNLYFLYLVRYRLIADGLSKYWRLFHFNAAILLVSLSMDILLLGMLSLPNPYDYVQFAPVAYIVKLYIELTMAVLISKVVRSSSTERVDDMFSSGNVTSNHTVTNRRTNPWPSMQQPDIEFPGIAGMDTKISGGIVDGLGGEDKGAGIMKTVTTVVKLDSDQESYEEYQMSTRRLTVDQLSHKSSTVEISGSS